MSYEDESGGKNKKVNAEKAKNRESKNLFCPDLLLRRFGLLTGFFLY